MQNGRPVVLIVEDEPVVLEVIALELRDAGFDVIGARTGEEATKTLDQGAHVDLIFTDVGLPGAIDGWEVAQRARKRQANIPVIYATGSFDDDPRRVEGGVFMSKPYHTANIIDAAGALGIKFI